MTPEFKLHVRVDMKRLVQRGKDKAKLSWAANIPQLIVTLKPMGVYKSGGKYHHLHFI